MKTFIGFSWVFAWVVLASAQAPDTLWTRTYGGSRDEWAYSVQQTTDSNYIVAGWTYSFGAGSSDMYLLKINVHGDTLWTHTYGGSDLDAAASVQQTRDGGYVAAGTTYSFGVGAPDLYLVKTNSYGDTLWTRTYGGSNWDYAKSVQQTIDGGYIVAGITYSFSAGDRDCYLVRTDAQGDTLWMRSYGGSNWDDAHSVRQTTDSSFIIAGCTYSYGAGSSDMYLLKTTAYGDTQWTRTYGGSGDDWAGSIQQTTDGGYIVAGSTSSFGEGGDDFYLVKTNAQGDTLWTRTYGGINDEWAACIQQTTDGGYIVVGRTQVHGSDFYDIYLVRTNAQGDTSWTCIYGGSGTNRVETVQQTADGGYIVAGRTDSFGAGGSDVYLVKTAPDPMNAERKPVSLPNQCTLHPNFPNPFNPSTQIAYELPQAERVTLKVFNLMGENIATLVDGMQMAGTHTAVFDGSGLASGVYFYRLQTAGFVQTRKMMLLK